MFFCDLKLNTKCILLEKIIEIIIYNMILKYYLLLLTVLFSLVTC